MSDSIPIKLHLVRADNYCEHFEQELFAFLSRSDTPATVRLKLKQSSGQRRGREHEVSVSSRNGHVISVLKNLIDRSGISGLGFIGDSFCSHEAIIENEWGTEVKRFTVIRGQFDDYVGRTEALIQWCRANPDITYAIAEGELGYDLDGREFTDVSDLIDNVVYSLDPNFDYCDGDYWDAAVTFCVLRTFQYLLKKAQKWEDWVVCEHWGGFA